MAEISKIQLPSGNVYDIKDATARSMISGGITFTVSWDGNSTPVVANIPQGVVVRYNDTNYTGTMPASSGEDGTFYLVKSGADLNKYDEYVVADDAWEMLGSQQIDLSNLGALAYKDSVSLSKGNGDQVLGESTTFTNGSSSVSFSGGSTDTFVKSYPGTTSKLSTTTVPNVTSAGSASSWSFAMGTGNDSETLIISGSNGTAPSLGTAITVATGSLSATGGGGTVMTGLGTASTASAVTGIGTGTAAAQTITVGTNDKVKVAKYDDLSVSAS
jgi:hypothetical protein